MIEVEPNTNACLLLLKYHLSTKELMETWLSFPFCLGSYHPFQALYLDFLLTMHSNYHLEWKRD